MTTANYKGGKIASSQPSYVPFNFDFAEYQRMANETAIYPPIGHPVVYPAMELADEAGEVLGKIKKIFRDKDGHFSDEDREAIAGELGDVIWALSQCCTELDLSLHKVARDNLVKLQSRKERDAIKGNGDNR